MSVSGPESNGRAITYAASCFTLPRSCTMTIASLTLVVRSERAFDFTQLNPEATNFYLMVNPTQEFQVAVRHPPNEVTCSVQPRSWL